MLYCSYVSSIAEFTEKELHLVYATDICLQFQQIFFMISILFAECSHYFLCLQKNCLYYFRKSQNEFYSLNTYISSHLLSIIGILLSKLQHSSFGLSHSASSASEMINAFRSSGLIPKSVLGFTKSCPWHWFSGTQLKKEK